MVSRRRFEQLATEALDELPAWVLERLENVDAPFQPAGNDALLRFGKKRYRRIHVTA